MKKSLCALIALLAFIYLGLSEANAAEKAKTQAPAAVAPTSKPAKAKELSKEEMVADLKNMIDDESDLLAAVPGLSVKEIDGKKIYEYKGKKLEDLDKETVLTIFNASNRFITMQNMQRIQQQMQTIKQVNDMNRMQRVINQATPPSVPKTPPVPPRVYTPPRTYK